MPQKAQAILGNLFYSVKLIASKCLPAMPMSGNVKIPADHNAIRRQQEGGDLHFNEEISAKIPEEVPGQEVFLDTHQIRRMRDKSQHAKSYADFPIAANLGMSRASLNTQQGTNLAIIKDEQNYV